jgi:hypothetical protein
MAEVSKQSLLRRIVGVAKLDAATFEEIEHDETATLPALIVAALAGISFAAGQILSDPTGFTIGDLMLVTIASVIVWITALVLFTTITYIIGGMLLRAETTELTWVVLLRTLGFAGVPIFVAGWMSFIPPVYYLAFGWFLAAVVVAVRQALDITTGRAIATALPGFIILALMQFALLYLIFRPV